MGSSSYRDRFIDKVSALSLEPVAENHTRNSELFGVDNIDVAKLVDAKPRTAGGETHRSLDEKSFSEIMNFTDACIKPRALETVKSSDCLEGMASPSMRACGGSITPRIQPNIEPHMMVSAGWEALRKSLVYFRGKPVGTIAASDPTEDSLNYNQDFVPSGLAFLMNGEPEIVRNFLLKALRLQAWEKHIDCFTLGEGVMPASFKVLHDPSRKFDTMIADFGESAIGRVAPVDSGFWWIILLRAYVKAYRGSQSSGNGRLSTRDEVYTHIVPLRWI